MLCIGIPVLVWLARKSEKRRTAKAEEAAKVAAEEQAEVRQAQVRKGTHDAHGHRLCITCQDGFTRATQTAFVFVSDDGVRDLVRRWFGAPARYTITQVKESDGTPVVYCDQCASAVLAEHQLKLLHHEQELRELAVGTAISHRRWVLGGVNDVVAARIEAHDKQRAQAEPRPKRAPVVTLGAGSG